MSNEADAWFSRNKEVLLNRKDFSHLDPVLKYIKKDENVLEMGSSFGYNLNYLMSKTHCKAYAVEPSGKAVQFGEELYPQIKFKQGTIDEENKFGIGFNHIIIGFCLYLADVELLPEIVFRIDKNLNKGGFLHIVDFDAKYPTERPYGHDPRIKTRKMDYASIFSAFPNYFIAEKNSWSHEGHIFHPDANERCSTVTLFKEI